MNYLHPGTCSGEGCGKCKFVAVPGPFRTQWGIAAEAADEWISQTLWIQKWLREQPGFLQRLANFGVALTKHAISGFEKRDQLEIKRILETCCKLCEFYSGKHCTHPDCGCNVNQEFTFFNKLAWKSESCPIGKW